MYIPDPVELMEARIERQCEMVDDDGNYPCCCCGRKIPVDDMITVSPSPDAPGICTDCAESELGFKIE